MIAGWETITNWKAETIVESSVGVIKPFLIAENTSIPPSIASGSVPTSLLMQYPNDFTGPVDVVCASCLWCSPKKMWMCGIQLILYKCVEFVITFAPAS